MSSLPTMHPSNRHNTWIRWRAITCHCDVTIPIFHHDVIHWELIAIFFTRSTDAKLQNEQIWFRIEVFMKGNVKMVEFCQLYVYMVWNIGTDCSNCYWGTPVALLKPIIEQDCLGLDRTWFWRLVSLHTTTEPHETPKNLTCSVTPNGVDM